MGRTPWLPRLVLGAVGIALLLVIIAIAVGEKGADPVRIDGAGETQQLISGIQQEGAYLGAADAPVTVTIFNDVQAPSGADFELDVVAPLVEEYVRTGGARLELRHFSFTERQTNLAAYAAVSAGEQARQWHYADLFLRNLPEEGESVTQDLLRGVANAVPELDADEWSEGIDSAAVQERVEADAQLAADLRLPAGPAVVITGPGGVRQLEEGPALAEIEAAISSLE